MMQSESYDKEMVPAPYQEANSQYAARAGIGIAVVLGIAADRLLWYGPVGPGWVLWIALFGTGAVVLVRQAGFAWQRETMFAAAIALCTASISAIRASDALHAISLVALIAAASLPLLGARAYRFGTTPMLAQLLGIPTVMAHAFAGAVPLVVRDAGRAALPARALRVPLLAARGALLAVPPLVVFGALFVSADPLFEHYAQSVARIATEDVIQHVSFAAVICWISAGLLRGLLPRRSVIRDVPALPTVPAAEVAIVLGSVTALFLAFVLVQARLLFGGAAALQAITGLTVAEYARRGAFQLLVAAALVLPLLIAAEATARSFVARRITRTLSCALIALVFVVMASAIQRMALYTQRFGLTEARLYGTAFMAWLAVVFAWYMITTLRGKPRRFAAGPVVAGLVATFALAAVNPDALIARVNLERAQHGATIDGVYLSRLSADAVPELVDHFDELPADARCHVAGNLIKRFSKTNADWRAANRSLLRAASLVNANAAWLKAVPPCAVKS